MSNTVRPIPQSVSLDSIDSFGNEFTIKWSGYQSSDFKSYKLYRSLDASMTDKVAIYTSYSSQDTSYFSIENDTIFLRIGFIQCFVSICLGKSS